MCNTVPQRSFCHTFEQACFYPESSKHSATLQICGGVTLSRMIYNVYKTGKANPSDIFKLQHETNKVIICGDFNIHHPLWGSDGSSPTSNTFVDYLNNSNLRLLNKQTPTRIDPRNKSLTHIDLSLASLDIDNINWSINQHNHDPKMSDHFPILLTLTMSHDPDASVYHNSWNLSSKSKWKKFQKLLSTKLNQTDLPTETNAHASHINNTIYNTAIETIGYRSYLQGNKPWWNSELSELKRNTKRLLRKLNKLKHKYPDSYKELVNYKQHLLEYNYQKRDSNNQNG